MPESPDAPKDAPKADPPAPKPGSVEEARAALEPVLTRVTNIATALTEDSDDAAALRGRLASVAESLGYAKEGR